MRCLLGKETKVNVESFSYKEWQVISESLFFNAMRFFSTHILI